MLLQTQLDGMLEATCKMSSFASQSLLVGQGPSAVGFQWNGLNATIDLLATPWVLEETHQSLLLPEEGRRKYIWNGKTEWKCEKQVNGMAKSA